MTHRRVMNTNISCIDAEDAAEVARLIDQNQLLTSVIGLFPEPLAELVGTQECPRVLDLACGPGAWALDVAFAHPEVEVIGVDVTASMVRYAEMRAVTQDRDNVSFEVADITKPLPFADASFAVVNAGFLNGCLRPVDWLPLLQECRRVLVPGGTLCLTESEWPLTTSCAFETLKRKVSVALWLAKQSCSPDGQDLGVTPLLGQWLRSAGYEQVQARSHVLDWSAGMPSSGTCFEQCRVVFALLRSFVLRSGMATAETYDLLYGQMLVELHMETFCALTTPLVVWGRTPRIHAQG